MSDSTSSNGSTTNHQCPPWCEPLWCGSDDQGNPCHGIEPVVHQTENHQWLINVWQCHELRWGDGGIGSLFVDMQVKEIDTDAEATFWMTRPDIPLLIAVLTKIYNETTGAK